MVVKSVSNIGDLQINDNNIVTVVHFYADWSEECNHIDEIMDALSSVSEFNHINFMKCAAENFPSISIHFNVNVVPTILFLKNGHKIDELTGADPAVLNKKLQQFAKYTPADDLLTNILSAEKVVVFIKGDDKSLECMPNKELLRILDECKVKYKTYNILADEALKQKIETYSGSTSFPQLYLKGNFAGDLETIRRLNSTGELSIWIDAVNKNLSKNLVQKLKSLIKKADIMVFMKGERDAPKCGFSRQLMEILKNSKLPFETFDILTDEEVRQSLKVYSDWPTYPQVYVKGELVGGLDIIKSLVEEGELMSTLLGEAEGR